MSGRGGRKRHKQRGMALITVLWLLALLTLLATTLVTLSVTERRTAQRYQQAVQADYLADGAIRVALLRMVAPQVQGAPITLGAAQSLRLLDTSVSVLAQRELGRVDLNTAEPDLLLALFAGNGWREEDARSLVDRIVAERAEPFSSVAEVRRIPGAQRLTAAIFDGLTVFTRSPGCVESAATPAVRQGLAWADERQLGGHRWLAADSGHTNSTTGGTLDNSLSGEVVRVRACLDLNGQGRCRVAVARLTGNLLRPLQVFEWQGIFDPGS